MASSQQILYPTETLCECADRFIACKMDEHIRWHKFKVGKKINTCLIPQVERVRRILCGPANNLCEEEIKLLSEKLNKLIS